MNEKKTTRRRFLVATIAFYGYASSATDPSILRISSAWAESHGKVEQDTLDAMVRMARLLFPHDALSDEVYGEVLDNTLASTATDQSFAAELNAAEEGLNGARAADWEDLDESEQLAVMQELEGEGFFAVIHGAVRAGLYFSAAFWKHIGYPGSSKEFGGYINRGSDDIDWLSENS
jgi:hypothetical protein